jgi:hypothetical protein
MVVSATPGAPVDRQEARDVARATLLRLAGRSFADLEATCLCPHTVPEVGPSGVTYYVELTAHWDDESRHVLRLTACADDGRLLSALAPASVDLIVPRPAP